MITKVGSKWVMACGYVPKDAEYKEVGSKNYPLTKFSIKYDEKENDLGQKIAQWLNCDCWNNTAKAAKRIEKGDVVLAVGTIRANESNGRTYKSLQCEFISIQGKTNTAIMENAVATSDIDVPEGFVPYDSGSDDDLPF